MSMEDANMADLNWRVGMVHVDDEKHISGGTGNTLCGESADGWTPLPGHEATCGECSAVMSAM